MATNVLRMPKAKANNFVPSLGNVKVSVKKHFPRNKIRCWKRNNEAGAATASLVVAPGSRLASIWREIQGKNNWEDLVEPLNPLLQEEIIRYGEFVAACYKAFDLDPNSKRYLSCKYGKKKLLEEVGLGESGYEVTKYIYATPDSNTPIQNGGGCGRWIGYVCVSNDRQSFKIGRRDVLITFRGTVTHQEWLANLMSSLTPARFDPNNPRIDVKVEAGFLSLYTSNENPRKYGLLSCREQLLSQVSRLIRKYPGEPMSITLAGHSMGSSLALLLGYDIAELGLNRRDSDGEIPVTVFSFGGPRVGNAGFKERCEELGVKVLRIVNVNDPITKLPGCFLNEGLKDLVKRYELPWSSSCYDHVGVELILDFFKISNPSCVHDLENYIKWVKCPKTSHVQKEGGDFTKRAKELFLLAKQFRPFSWKIAAMNILQLQMMLLHCTQHIL